MFLNQIVCVLILLMGADLFCKDWPQWRGLHRDGIIQISEIPQAWPEQLKKVWQIEVGTGHSSPIFAHGSIYIFSRQEDNEVISRINPSDGQVVWQKSYPAPYEMNWAARGHGKGPKSTPVVSGNYIVTLGIGGILSCFNTETGNLLWQKEFSKTHSATAPLYGTSMSPLIDGNLCIAHVGGNNDGALSAFDLKTGKTVWQWLEDGPGYASPVVLKAENTAQVVTFSQQNIVTVDLASGKLLWKMPFTTPWIQNCVTPVIYKNDLILSGLSNGVMRLQLSKNGDTYTPEKVWENKELGAYMSTPVMFDDLLLLFSNKNKGLYVTLNPESGEILWQSQGREGDNAALTRAGDFLISLTTEASLIIAKRDGTKFTFIKQYTVADSPTWAHPTIFAGNVLIKDETRLSLFSFK